MIILFITGVNIIVQIIYNYHRLEFFENRMDGDVDDLKTGEIINGISPEQEWLLQEYKSSLEQKEFCKVILKQFIQIAFVNGILLFIFLFLALRLRKSNLNIPVKRIHNSPTVFVLIQIFAYLSFFGFLVLWLFFDLTANYYFIHKSLTLTLFLSNLILLIFSRKIASNTNSERIREAETVTRILFIVFYFVILAAVVIGPFFEVAHA